MGTGPYYPRNAPVEIRQSQVITAGTSGTISVALPQGTKVKSIDVNTGGATLTAVTIDGVDVGTTTPIDIPSIFGEMPMALTVTANIDNTAGTTDVTAEVIIKGTQLV